ncbi:allantoate amidohydrolase [Rhodobacteraceae bacterium WD3A24]|nr:allantoate amidohydrolase [Rhodobacteraceae bacterium WD3A24]
MTDDGDRAAAMLDEIAAVSEPGAGVTRLPFTAEHARALDIIRGWMEAAGLVVSLDAAGTLAGRLEGPPGAPTLLLGSHQDSVREGGRYDGIMGVLLPILAVEKLRERGIRLPFAVECLAFADEEGVRFPTALIGSRALAGRLDPAVLDMADADGVTLRAAMEGFGLDPEALPQAARDPGGMLGFLECHIEQGPVLQVENQALGVVTAICGIERHGVTLTGEAGHAGTIPMALRRDALAGAAEIIGEVERSARETDGLLGTVGALSVAPGVVNAVPGEVRMSVELRAPDDAVRETAGAAVHRFCGALAERRGLAVTARRDYAQPAIACDPQLTATLADAVKATGGAGLALPSGATHDASAMADLCPVTMLFVRCRDGISHNPAEYAAPADMGAAVAAIAGFIETLRPGQGA